VYNSGNEGVITGSEQVTTISVQLPDDVRLFAETYAKKKGFSSVNDFISSLLMEVKDRQTQLEAELLAGLESGPAEAKSDDDWLQLRTRVAAKGTR
jgi:Arc/MetJ-type ribon-helix-helix transcriptional regulator